VDPQDIEKEHAPSNSIEVSCSEEVQSDVPPTVVSDTPLVNHSEEMAEGANEALPLSDHSRPRRQAAVRGEQI